MYVCVNMCVLMCACVSMFLHRALIQAMSTFYKQIPCLVVYIWMVSTVLSPWHPVVSLCSPLEPRDSDGRDP